MQQLFMDIAEKEVNLHQLQILEEFQDNQINLGKQVINGRKLK